MRPRSHGWEPSTPESSTATGAWPSGAGALAGPVGRGSPTATGSPAAGKKRRTGWARTPRLEMSARCSVATVAAKPFQVRSKETTSCSGTPRASSAERSARASLRSERT